MAEGGDQPGQMLVLVDGLVVLLALVLVDGRRAHGRIVERAPGFLRVGMEAGLELGEFVQVVELLQVIELLQVVEFSGNIKFYVAARTGGGIFHPNL